MFGLIGNIGAWELVFILLIALIVVGPGKLPEVARGVGKAAREFKKATSGVQKELNDVMRFDDDKPKTNIKKEYETIVNTTKEKDTVDNTKNEDVAEAAEKAETEEKAEGKTEV